MNTAIIGIEFVNGVVATIITAYNTGLLQHFPLTLGGITVEMTMTRSYNTLTFTNYISGHKVSFNAYDDTADTNGYMIESCIKSFYV